MNILCRNKIKGANVLKPPRITRKQFLKLLCGFAITASASGAFWKLFLEDRLNPPRQQYVSNTGTSVVSITEGSSNTNIENLVRHAVDSIGGMEQVVSPGQTVVIKPAVLASTPNCAPDPMVVAAVAKLAQEAGGTVIVAENSASGGAEYCLSRIGITSAVEALGIDAIDLTSEKEIQMEVSSGVKLQTVKTYPTIYNCDVLISVPRLKRHGSATVTISLKNMMGTITRSEMGRFHRIGLSQCIADLNTVIRPNLAVVDATAAMTRTGPTGGDMVEMNTIFASTDPVACDRIAAQRLHELERQLDISSFDVDSVKHINAAAALGIGTNNLDEIQIIEKMV
jgi:uncharacterized protein (DUF362 family)